MNRTTVSAATLPVVRALLDEARRKNYRSGVLGVRARPEWTGADTFVHDDVPVRVVPCVSALAVREALLDRDRDRWLVVLTDRPEDDLGAGVLSHFLWYRLRTPDPWEAVRHRFAATGIDPALTVTPSQRELAVGLLAATPSGGWPPAPGGVLTRDHALGAVARVHLGLGGPDVDAHTVLTWTTDTATVGLVADLRALAGDPLTDAVLEWAARRVGTAGAPLLHVLRSGEGRDAVPLGLVVGVLVDARDGRGGETAQVAREALIRLEPRMGGAAPSAAALRSWTVEAAAVTTGLLGDGPAGRATAERALARADEILVAVHAQTLADGSELLPAGLTVWLARLAAALRVAVADGAGVGDLDRDAPQVLAEALAGVEREWALVAAHHLADGDRRTAAFRAAVRLVRWLATATGTGSADLVALLGRHRDVDGWVDSAVNDAAPGVGDPDLGAGLAAVLAVVRRRRDAHDSTFAAALAVHTADDPGAGRNLVQGGHRGVRHVEDVLPEVVLPLARATPVLLLVLDGIGVGVGTEIMAGVLARATDGWAEALLPGQTRRAAALAALPTLTEVSRASLLCGELRTGGQDVERLGYADLTRAHGLRGAALFHKKPLDSSRLGYAVADDVGAAMDDVTGRPLVTCVLNTVDDALDRSDPGGTDWGADVVRHLAPLLDRARRAGRVVVLTADHGHVVERRQGRQRPHPVVSSGRSRDASESAGDGEVLVAGRRVLLHDGRAVLAVDERLRYGPLKAGYHGGAASAEAVVPVAVLVPGTVPEGVDLRLAPPQEPSWWTGSGVPAGAAPSAGPPAPSGRPAPSRPPASATTHATPTLFDETAAEIGVPGRADRGSAPVVNAVLRSATYAAQKRIAGRVSTTDEQVGALLAALLAAPGHRLAPAPAATSLAVSPVALRGAVLHVQRLLNVEGYPVLRVDADGATVILDEPLLREQFGVRS